MNSSRSYSHEWKIQNLILEQNIATIYNLPSLTEKDLANSVNPDQYAPEEADQSRSLLFAFHLQHFSHLIRSLYEKGIFYLMLTRLA